MTRPNPFADALTDLAMQFERVADYTREQADRVRSDQTLPPDLREALARAHTLHARAYLDCAEETRTALARAQERAHWLAVADRD